MRRKLAVRWLYRRHELELRYNIRAWLNVAEKMKLLNEAVHDWLSLIEESEKANATS